MLPCCVWVCTRLCRVSRALPCLLPAAGLVRVVLTCLVLVCYKGGTSIRARPVQQRYPVTELMDVRTLHPREILNGHLPLLPHAILMSWEGTHKYVGFAEPIHPVGTLIRCVGALFYCELISFGSSFRQAYSRITPSETCPLSNCYHVGERCRVTFRWLDISNSLVTDLTSIPCPFSR